MRKLILLLLFYTFSIEAQNETQFPTRRTVNDEIKEDTPEKITSINSEEKKYSAQFILGSGKGSINILNDKYDPNTSLSEFIALSLFSASQASPSYASSLSGNLGSSSLLALFLLNDEISSNLIRSNSKSSVNRFYLENRLTNDSIGLQFGLSSGNYSFKADSSRYTNVFLPTVFFGNTNPLINIYMMESFLKSSKPIYLSVDTFDIALKFHFLHNSKLDPYFSLGSGIGSCFNNCYALRLFGRLGARVNFNEYYLFLEEEIQTVFFSTAEKKYSPLQERLILLGFGFNL